MDEMGDDEMGEPSARPEAMRLMLKLLDALEAERVAPKAAPIEEAPAEPAPGGDEMDPETMAALKAKLEEMTG